MTRTAARQIAIQLGFAAAATGEEPLDICDSFFEKEYYESLSRENKLFSEYPDDKQMEYIRTLTSLIAEHRDELDGFIEKYARGWKLDRISKTARAVMRCAMCEVLYMPEVPNAAAINEAVELSKGYDEAETVSFINGILGSFMREELGEKTEDGE